MADPAAQAEVWLWGRFVGAVVELDDGSIVFEYDPAFRNTGLEISPLRLPSSTRGPVRFPELQRLEAFRGLPGVLADALPDAFGKQVIRAYYTARGEERHAFSPVQHLLYVGDRGIGALEFRPARELPSRAAEETALEIARLVADARRILAGDPDVTIPEIYRIGSSAGGARPKAVVLYNAAKGEIRSAFAVPREGDRKAILKFDGVGREGRSAELGVPQPYNRVEAAYNRMAADAGIDIARLEMLVSPSGHAHLVIDRFDFDAEGPLHQHTLGGLLHVDYNVPGASSYEEYLRTILRLDMAPADVLEGYRRMVFNVLAVNQDDHVKNLSFHMDRAGRWSLTPAYDVTFARGDHWTARHQMRVADKRAEITRQDLLGVAAAFGIRKADEVIDRVAEVLSRWPSYADRTAVPPETVAHIQDELDRRAGSLRG